LSLGQTVSLLQTVFPRGDLTKGQAIDLLKEQIARSRAARRSHLHRRGRKRDRRKASTHR
jgi:hypothetical protein